MKKLKKALLGVGAIGAIISPIATVIACGGDEKKKEISYYESKIKQEDMIANKTWFVTDGGDIKDKSFNESIAKGAQAARSITGEEVFTDNVQKPSKPSEIVNKYSAIKSAGGKLIVAGGFNHSGAIKAFAPENSDMGFVFVDGTFNVDKDGKMVQASNVASVIFDMKAPSFVMGILAAIKATKMDDATPNIGVYGGMNIPPVTDYINAFIKGIKYYNTVLKGEKPTVAIVNGNFVGNFEKAGKSKTIADNLANKNVELILAVGGPQYTDALAAVKEKKHGEIIGVDVITKNKVENVADQALVFGSIIKGLKSTTQKAVEAIYAEDSSKFGFGKVYLGTLANQAVGFSISGVDKSATADVKATLATALGVKADDAKVTAIITKAEELK